MYVRTVAARLSSAGLGQRWATAVWELAWLRCDERVSYGIQPKCSPAPEPRLNKAIPLPLRGYTTPSADSFLAQKPLSHLGFR